MAEYIVAFVVEKIASQLLEEAGSFGRVRCQIEWIEGELRRMQCFLKDADTKQDGDERVRNWVAEIRDVAYGMDDVLDSFIMKTTWQHKQKQGSSVMNFKRYTLFFLNKVIAQHETNKQVGRIKMKISQISDSRSVYGIENIGRSGEEGRKLVVERLRDKRRSNPHDFDQDGIIGLEEDMLILESRLIHGESRTSVVSIIGMAGLGKTTLAKMIYNSFEVKQHFDCSAWVCVSHEYEAKEILQDLCKSAVGIGKLESEKMSKEDLEEKLSSFLKERRYIIVLDDIWKTQVWDDLKATFPERENGSRILLTTRFRDVALHADPRSLPHELRLLNVDDSWELLSKKVFQEYNAEEILPPWSKELGYQIVKRCGGLPLAIIVLGGLLSRRNPTYSEWLKVLQSVHWQLTQDPTQFSEILALSYSDLPYYLKQCFLYFGLFPEDFEISARRLILLWVAEGFVQPRGQEPLEDVAEDYLEEIIGRSMVQVATRKSNGRIKTCRVHDLLRELSLSKAKEDRFLDVIRHDVKAISTRSRRLAIHSGFPPAQKSTQKLRSLLCFHLNQPIRKLKKFNFLRVLDLEGVYLAFLDSSIGKLFHLRYLGLRGTWLKKLPSSICLLSNLQTLDLRSTLLNPIPNAIWKMQLRHLYLNELRDMVVCPHADTTLANLQTLHGLYIDGTSCIQNGLNKLTNLRELRLHGDLHLQEEALSEWIFNLKGLQCLKLDSRTKGYDDNTSASISKPMTFSDHSHLCKLHLVGFIKKLIDIEDFPPNLTELCLQGSFLTEDPMKKLEMLPNLRVLKLKKSAFVGKEMVCSNGGFSQLHLLKLSFLYSVETWRIEDGAMGKLRQLEINECERLKIVPNGLSPVTTLQNLKLGCMPYNYQKKAREREEENWYRIEHVLPCWKGYY